MGEISPAGIHGLKVTFGRHKGELWTRVPVSYLFWIVNQEEHQAIEFAKAELRRRGTTVPQLEISAHAIDRISQRLLNEWQIHRHGVEGLHAWAHRVAHEAIKRGKEVRQDVYEWSGAKWVFERGAVFPVLKTVYVSASEDNSEEPGRE